MTPPNAVRNTLDVLRKYFADREGRPWQLNDVQVAAYLDALATFSPECLEAAARSWILQSPFFPKVSDLLSVLESMARDAFATYDWYAECLREHGGVCNGQSVHAKFRGHTFGPDVWNPVAPPSAEPANNTDESHGPRR